MSDLIGIFKKLGKLKDLRTNKKTDLVSSINEVNDKANASVSSVEAGLNYNTIKITKNDGTTENILIKVQGGSDSINVFKTAQHGGSFVATENTDTFTIEGIDSTKDVQVIYKNFFLVPNVDYTVDKETGEVGLGFTLEKDEVIYYLITDTSFDYNELNNLPNIGNIEGLNTSSKEIVGGINEILEKEKSNAEQINALSNPNLLINGDFQVWQRGESFDTSDKNRTYTADRWRIYNYKTNSPVISKSSNGINVKGSTQYQTLIYQMVENKIYPSLYGKSLTLSCEYKFITGQGSLVLNLRTDSTNYNSGGAVNRVEKSASVENGTKGKLVATLDEFIDGYGTLMCAFAVKNTGSVPFEIEVKNVKLEIGDKATPFIPRTYAEELALCQRYYQKISYGTFAGCVGSTANKTLSFLLPTIVPLRVAPTLTTTVGNLSVRKYNNTSCAIASYPTAGQLVKDRYGIIYQVTLTDTPEASLYSLIVASGSLIEMDAEIY